MRPGFPPPEREFQQAVFILDLAAPRDFDPASATWRRLLYDIDSLSRTCEENRKARVREIEKAAKIVETETVRLAEIYRRRAAK